MSMTSSQIMTNRSLAVILNPMMQVDGSSNIAFTKLESLKVMLRQLDLPSDEISTWKFVVSLKEFHDLGRAKFKLIL